MSKPWLFVAVIVACASIGAAYVMLGAHEAAEAANSEAREEAERPRAESGVQVEVVSPHEGGLARTTTQPGSVIPDKAANLFAKVAGYLKEQSVDIGSPVKEGDVLAVIDVPELHKEVERSEAALDQAKAAVKQAQARVVTAEAEWKASVAIIEQYKASVEDAEASLSFRKKVFERLQNLAVVQKAVDMKLVDEKEEQKHAAEAALTSAHASVLGAEAQASAAKAKIEQAKADLEDAKARVEVADAQLQKDRVLADYTTIRSPYTGIITERFYWPGDFVQSRDQGATTPMLIVQKTDVMRVKVQVPDADVPFTNPGDEAAIHIDALPGKDFKGKVSRVAGAEDSETRTMRVEIDLSNKERLLRDGMYGKVTIQLEKPSKGLTVPSAALAGELEDGQATLYVARGGIAKKLKVRIGADDGIRTEVLSGLEPDDEVILTRGSVADGVKVIPVRGQGTEQAKAGHH